MAVAALVTALKNSGRRMGRSRYLVWVLVSVIGIPIVKMTMDLVASEQATLAPWGFLASLLVTVLMM